MPSGPGPTQGRGRPSDLPGVAIDHRQTAPVPAYRLAERRSLARKFVVALERRAHSDALLLAAQLLDAGMRPDEIILGLIAPAQVEIGRRWQAGAISHHHERVATRTADAVLDLLHRNHRTSGDRGRLVLALADREHHNLPARMVADLLRLEGFAVQMAHPGEGTPALEEFDAVVLSCSIAMNLPGVVPVIDAAHAAGRPVIAGGRGFGTDDRRARALGADAWAATVPQAAARLDAWRSDDAPRGRPIPRDDALHRELVRRRPELLTIAGRFTSARASAFAGVRHQHVARLPHDVGHLLSFVEAAALCDARILADYVVWLQPILDRDGFPPPMLRSLLETLADALDPDVPQAAGLLRAAI